MGFKDLIKNAKASSAYGGEFFMPDTRGTIVVDSLTHHKGFKGETCVLEATIVTSEPNVSGGKSQTPGTKVKKLYLLTKYPEVAPGQLQRDILSLVGLDPSDVTPDQMDTILAQVFDDPKSEGYGLRGVKAQFEAKNIDRSDKGKTPVTSIMFRALPE